MSPKTGIAIVWPSWFLGSVDPELHATALFLGNTDTTTFSREAIQDVLDHICLDPGPVKVTGMDLFGKDKTIPVLTIENKALTVVQQWMERELDLIGIVSPSTFPFNPHVTIAKEMFGPTPHYIQLEAPVLWWGEQRALHSKHQEVKAAA